jgi:sterol desaturase/sphingolipid hydroxylase (fatty acid hydroxylase superfamily)
MSIYLSGNQSYLIILTVIFLRYLVIAGLAFLIFYVIKKRKWAFKRIQSKFPLNKDYIREIVYSTITAFVFAGVGYLVFLTPFVWYTKAYFVVEERGVGYLALSILMTIILHDTYFYWMHRLMHHSSVYRWVHRVHHLSTNPSPWAAMAFHPLEAVLEAGIIVIVSLLIPIHPLAIGIFLLFMMLYNVYGHLGYELYPKGFAKSSIGKWINTSFNHNQHHQFFKGNYGLYFLFWDRLMGTLRQDYEEQFDLNTDKSS